MEQLSSCYFCGAALDAQVEPYQVIPRHLDPSNDQQRAVALCPSCRRKLATIVETVVGATDPHAEVTTTDASTPEPTGGLLDDDSLLAGADDGTSVIDEPPGPNRSGSEVDDDPQDSTEAIERTPSMDSATGNEPDERSTGAGTERDPLSSSEPTAEEQSPVSDQSTETAPDSEQESYSAGDRAEDDGPSLTALEYNKVMRLLQNREFPVDRAEIKAVATNAYDVSDQEFDAIIDAAVERGLLQEEGSQLVGGD